MRFAEPLWLFGTGVGVFLAVFLILGGVLGVRAARRFGVEEQVRKLFTANASSRRAVKGVLLVLAVAAAFVALAQPQYGRGTRTIPATNLDVVITLDYSKSMYAQDIPPFRIERAKAEVADLVAALPGARFGAVAFAGEPMSFPLTSDSGAIKQFLNQLSPNDMPVGGTAIARALESARDLLARDPISRRHKRVIILITDGEDLEGDPVQVAQSCAQEDITVHVVQIGSRTAEPLPEIDSAGRVTGLRKDESGATVTTALSAEGEAALAKIAEVSGGTIVRSQRGKMGIDAVTSRLRKLMTEELSEKVETVYADVYMYPLSVALFLLFVEVLIGEAKRRGPRGKLPQVAGPEEDVHSTKRRESRAKAGRARATVAGLLLFGFGLPSCDPNPSKWFERYSPTVDEAVEKLDAGDSEGAQKSLIEYLKTGKCEAGKIGTPESVKERPFAGFDLGLALFQLAEKFGKKFGEEGLAHGATPDAPPDPAAQKAAENRRDQVDCALRLAQAIALDPATPPELRARAHYLSGNLEFLRGNYRGAVSHYDKALTLVPGVAGDAGDLLGQDAAFNRAIALRRIDEEKPDASPDAGSDGGEDGGSDAQSDAGQDAGDASPDAGQDGGSPKDQDSGSPDAGDAGQDQPKDAGGADAGADDAGEQKEQKTEQKPSEAENQRVMDMLERAPTLQQELAKKARVRRSLSAAEDK